MITVEHLTKRYGDFLAVDDLSFEITEGHVYGFLGPNGAGKSTTMNIMTGCLSATKGSVRIDGHDIFQEPGPAKRLIGYLPEQPPLYMNETPAEYLRFVGEAKGIRGRELERQIDSVVEQVGIGEVRNRCISALSKGYRQRVGIAQALLGDPEIVILDEPTVGLDPKQIIEIRALIRDLARAHTVILSSHILAEVQAVCDRILIIHHGRMVASGTPEELERDLAGDRFLQVTMQTGAERGLALLRGIPGAGPAELLPGAAEGESTFRLESAGGDLREAVFRACVREEVPLLGLHAGGMTLEDVFLQLTADDAQEEPDQPPEDREPGAEAAGEEDAP